MYTKETSAVEEEIVRNNGEVEVSEDVEIECMLGIDVLMALNN